MSRTSVVALLCLVSSWTSAGAQTPDMVLRCTGTIELSGTKAAASRNTDPFDLTVVPETGVIKGGFAEWITRSENFRAKVTETEYSGTAVGETMLKGVVLMPGAYYSLNRFTGTYLLQATLRFMDSGDFTDYKARATCERASRKF